MMDQSEEPVEKAIVSLGETYRVLIQNHALQRELSRSTVSPAEMRLIDDMLSLPDANPKLPIEPFSLCEGVVAMLTVIKALRSEVAPAIKRELAGYGREQKTIARTALQLTASNLDSNLRILVDRLADLYGAVSQLDERKSGKAGRIAKRFPELADPSTWSSG